jgi:dsRNA-specific ribonuclease
MRKSIRPGLILNQMSDQNRLELAFEEYYRKVLKDKEPLKALDHSGNLEEKAKYALAGDALLNFHLYEYLMDKPKQSTLKMDAIRQTINPDKNLAWIGRRLGLRKYIKFPNSATESEKESGDAYYNMTIEALAYVVFMNGGIDASRDFFKKFIEPDVEELISDRP